MTQMNQSIEVDVSVQTAYNHWTQFESFPQFMSGVERIEQVSDNKTHWVTKIMGVTREFDAEITEQHPDEWLRWKTEGGLNHTGEVLFKDASSGDRGTMVVVQLEYEPQDIIEKAGDELGLVAHRLQSDLKKFKKFVESKDGETGEAGEADGWRGEIGEPLEEDEKINPPEERVPGAKVAGEDPSVEAAPDANASEGDAPEAPSGSESESQSTEAKTESTEAKAEAKSETDESREPE